MRYCVFCGSRSGELPAFERSAVDMGRALVSSGAGLVYGGGRVGLMGTIADAVLDAGGEVIGVIPRGLVNRELAHIGLTELRIVGSMHERKSVMAELSDGFISLPGGFGTMEEFFETVTWSLLGIHRKACGLLNVAGYYDSLIDLLDSFVRSGFATPEQRSLVLVDDDPLHLLRRLQVFEGPTNIEWIDDTNA